MRVGSNIDIPNLIRALIANAAHDILAKITTALTHNTGALPNLPPLPKLEPPRYAAMPRVTLLIPEGRLS